MMDFFRGLDEKPKLNGKSLKDIKLAIVQTNQDNIYSYCSSSYQEPSVLLQLFKGTL